MFAGVDGSDVSGGGNTLIMEAGRLEAGGAVEDRSQREQLVTPAALKRGGGYIYT